MTHGRAAGRFVCGQGRRYVYSTVVGGSGSDGGGDGEWAYHGTPTPATPTAPPRTLTDGEERTVANELSACYSEVYAEHYDAPFKLGWNQARCESGATAVAEELVKQPAVIPTPIALPWVTPGVTEPGVFNVLIAECWTGEYSAAELQIRVPYGVEWDGWEYQIVGIRDLIVPRQFDGEIQQVKKDFIRMCRDGGWPVELFDY